MKTDTGRMSVNQVGRAWRRYRPRRRTTVGAFLSVVLLLNVLLLGVMFAIFHSEVVLRPGINVQLPGAEFREGAPYNTMVLTITQEGLIFFNDERLMLDDLVFALQQELHRRGDAVLSVEADLRVQYGTIVRVVNMAGTAGVRRVNLAVRPEFPGGMLP